MYKYFSHAETTHKTSPESIEHLFAIWYTAIPLYLILIALAGALVYFMTKKSFAKTYISISAIMLASGIFLYDFSPTASATGITVGLFSAILMVYAGLSK